MQPIINNTNITTLPLESKGAPAAPDASSVDQSTEKKMAWESENQVRYLLGTINRWKESIHLDQSITSLIEQDFSSQLLLLTTLILTESLEKEGTAGIRKIKSAIGGLLSKFCFAMAELREKNDRTQIVNYFANIGTEIRKITGDKRILDYFPPIVSYHQVLFGKRDLEQLSLSIGAFLESAHQHITSEDLFKQIEEIKSRTSARTPVCFAIKSYALLFGAAEWWNFIQARFVDESAEWAFKLLNSSKEMVNYIPALGKMGGAFSITLFKDITKSLRRAYEKRNETHAFVENTMSMMFTDISRTYQSVVSLRDNNAPLDASYVQRHRNIYEQFLPRIYELRNALASLFSQQIENARYMKHLPFYLRFGKHAQFRKRLEEEKLLSSARFDAILKEEIFAFAEQRKGDPELDAQCKKALEEMKGLQAENDAVNFEEAFFTKYLTLLEHVFQRPLEIASKTQNDLFRPVVEAPAAGKRKNRKEKEKGTPSVAASTAVKPKEVERKEETFLEKWQATRDCTWKSFDMLRENCQGSETKEALINAEMHFDELLCTLRRMATNSKEVISREEVLSFLLDVVRHASLGAEQMLSAMSQESNGGKTAQSFSHHLGSLLLQCRFKGPLNHNARQWLLDVSNGEILMRNLIDCSWEANNASSLKQLLAKMKVYAFGTSCPFSAQELIRNAGVFLEGAVHTAYELHAHINSAKAVPANNQMALAQEFKDAFQKLLKTLFVESERKKYAKAPAQSKSSLFSMAKILQTKTDSFHVKALAGNLQKNLLAHLSVEAERTAVQPFEARLYLCNTFYSNQLIAEEFLSALLYDLSIDFNEGHDLSQLIVCLDLAQSDFTKAEWEFLKRGKTIRHLTRYMATFAALGKGEKSQVVKGAYEANTLSINPDLKANLIQEKLNLVKTLVQEDLGLLQQICNKAFAKWESKKK